MTSGRRSALQYHLQKLKSDGPIIAAAVISVSAALVTIGILHDRSNAAMQTAQFAACMTGVLLLLTSGAREILRRTGRTEKNSLLGRSPLLTFAASMILGVLVIGGLARPKIEAGMAYQVGKTQLEAGNFATAEAGFSRYVELLPESPIGYYWRGLTRFRAGQYENAHADMTRAIALRPADRTGRVLYLATLDRLGRSSEFELERANAAKLDPEFEQAFDRILADIEG